MTTTKDGQHGFSRGNLSVLFQVSGGKVTWTSDTECWAYCIGRDFADLRQGMERDGWVMY